MRLGAEVCQGLTDWFSFALYFRVALPLLLSHVLSISTRPQGPSFTSVNDALPGSQSRHVPGV